MNLGLIRKTTTSIFRVLLLGKSFNTFVNSLWFCKNLSWSAGDKLLVADD